MTVNGAGVNQTVEFAGVPVPSDYLVTFNESGLPTDTSWSVALNGQNGASGSASVVFEVLNGTYAYSIYPVTGYAADPVPGRSL